MARGQSAWLLLWEWSGDHAAVEDKLAGIFRPFRSRRLVGEIVQAIYDARSYSPSELAEWARRPNANPYRVQWHNDSCYCGSNPSLHANYVGELQISIDRQTRLETVSWVYPPLFEVDRDTMLPKEVRGDLPASLTRTIVGPLSQRALGREVE